MQAVAAQDYSSDLMEIIVVDDGSASPPDSATLPAGARLVWQKRYGFGAVRARNTGAGTATGDVLLFLDGDMVPDPGYVSKLMAWHHWSDYALTMGAKCRFDPDAGKSVAP